MKPQNEEPMGSDQDAVENGTSRRDFLATSASTVAAATILGVGASRANAAVAPPEPDSPDTTPRWDTAPGELVREPNGKSRLNREQDELDEPSATNLTDRS